MQTCLTCHLPVDRCECQSATVSKCDIVLLTVTTGRHQWVMLTSGRRFRVPKSLNVKAGDEVLTLRNGRTVLRRVDLPACGDPFEE